MKILWSIFHLCVLLLHALDIGFTCPIHSSARSSCHCDTIRQYSTLPNGQLASIEIKVIKCEDGEDKTIPRFSSRGGSVDRIIFQNNLIETIQDYAFVRLSRKNIKEIHFLGDKIREVGINAFAGLQDSLEVLTFSESNFTEIPRFQGLTLKKLELRQNQISKIRDEVFSELKCRKLYLEDNGIKNVEDRAFTGVRETLKHLSLRNNDISAISENAFYNLHHLEILNLEQNQISSIAAGAFRRCDQLKELNLASNRLYHLPSGVFSGLQQSLNILNLNANLLATVRTETFSDLLNLEELMLANNQIRELEPNAFKNCTNLKSLRLERNKINSLPSLAFSGLENTLGFLYLQLNELRIIPRDVFSNLRELGELWLHHNGIRRVQTGAFKNCTKLFILSLTGNNITHIRKETLKGVESSLLRLYLDSNHLRVLDYGIIETLHRLRVLYINSNRFRCDCRMKWLEKMDELLIMTDWEGGICSQSKNRRRQREYEMRIFLEQFCNDDDKQTTTHTTSSMAQLHSQSLKQIIGDIDTTSPNTQYIQEFLTPSISFQNSSSQLVSTERTGVIWKPSGNTSLVDKSAKTDRDGVEEHSLFSPETNLPPGSTVSSETLAMRNTNQPVSGSTLKTISAPGRELHTYTYTIQDVTTLSTTVSLTRPVTTPFPTGLPTGRTLKTNGTRKANRRGRKRKHRNRNTTRVISATRTARITVGNNTITPSLVTLQVESKIPNMSDPTKTRQKQLFINTSSVIESETLSTTTYEHNTPPLTLHTSTNHKLPSGGNNEKTVTETQTTLASVSNTNFPKRKYSLNSITQYVQGAPTSISNIFTQNPVITNKPTQTLLRNSITPLVSQDSVPSKHATSTSGISTGDTVESYERPKTSGCLKFYQTYSNMLLTILCISFLCTILI